MKPPLPSLRALAVDTLEAPGMTTVGKASGQTAAMKGANQQLMNTLNNSRGGIPKTSINLSRNNAEAALQSGSREIVWFHAVRGALDFKYQRNDSGIAHWGDALANGAGPAAVLVDGAPAAGPGGHDHFRS